MKIAFKARDMNIQLNFKVQRRYVFLVIFLTCLLPFLLSASNPIYMLVLGNEVKISLVFYFFYVHFHRSFYIAQFVLACSAMQLRFKELNNNLNFSFSVTEIKIVASKNYDLFKVGKLFHDLCDGIEILNQTFTFHLIAILMNTMVSFIFKKREI